jgi:hypothetical protein
MDKGIQDLISYFPEKARRSANNMSSLISLKPEGTFHHEAKSPATMARFSTLRTFPSPSLTFTLCLHMSSNDRLIFHAQISISKLIA